MPRYVSYIIYFASFLSFIAGVILLYDTNAAVSNPGEYRFGDISMMAKWGEAYRSLPAYVNATIKTAAIFFFCSTLLSSFGSILLVLKRETAQ